MLATDLPSAAPVADLLSALPYAVAVMRGGLVVWANPAMRAWIGERPAERALALVRGRRDLVARGDDTFEVRREPLAGGAELWVLDPDAGLEARFLSIASHDLRGTLANVRSFAALLATRGGQYDDRTRRGIDVIVRNSDKALRQTRDVFDVLRHRIGALPFALEETDAGGVIRQAADRFAAEAEAKGATFDARIALEIGRVPVDPERLLHATLGYLDHGLSRVEGGGTLRLSAYDVAGSVYVGVTDWGKRPTAAELAAPYSRARVIGEHKLGHAFALCLAHDEVEAMGGDTGVSEDGAGATTWFFTVKGAADRPTVH